MPAKASKTIATANKLEPFLKTAIEGGASDIHLVGNMIPAMRVHGVLADMATEILAAKEIENIIAELLGPERFAQFKKDCEFDLAHDWGGWRFRVNLHMQRGVMALNARLIPKDIPTAESLGLDESLLNLTTLPHGLVLVTGPTGSGKSSTLAAMIQRIHDTRRVHIITMEDPIEFMYGPGQSIIEQRELGSDTISFDRALKYALRQDPNVILVGEMRDQETIQAVLTAAETGHLVFSTLHTPSAPEAVERIVDMFEGARQKQVLIQLSSVLRAVVAQQLLPKAGGGRVAAREVLINTPAIGNLIRENKLVEINFTMQTGLELGMITMARAMERLATQGLIATEQVHASTDAPASVPKSPKRRFFGR